MNIEQTIDDNIGLVRKMACNLYYENPVYSRDDLIQVGLLNLITALQQYNSKKSKLSTFICHCVKNSMVKFIDKNNDAKKIHQSKFDSLPLHGGGDQRRKTTFFNSSFINKGSYYNESLSIDDYIKDSDTVVKDVIKLKTQGKTNTEIKNELGLSHNKIKRILQNIEQQIKGIN